MNRLCSRTLWTTTLLGAPVGTLPAIATNQEIDEGLIAYWNMDEGSGDIAHDASAHENNGHIAGAAWVTGRCGSALEFVDHDLVQYIPNTFDDSVTDGLTVASWVYWYGEHPGTYSANSYVLDARQVWSGGFILYLNPDGTALLLLITASGTLQTIQSNAAVPSNTWTHVAVVLDRPSQTLRVFIDGVEDATVAAPYPYSDTDGTVAIGNNRWAPGDSQWAPFNGVIDDLRVYARALTPTQVLEVASMCGDCNLNGLPDWCDVDCGAPSGPCDLPGCGQSLDCITNGIPDECEADCNLNGSADSCDIAVGTTFDCNNNQVPDECESYVDCNANAVLDGCDVAGGTSADCNYNHVPDECELPDDCNQNDVPDACDVSSGDSNDCNQNWIPDECEDDCNDNGLADECDLAAETSLDCNRNEVPDECDVDAGTSSDCNDNDRPDECDAIEGGDFDADIDVDMDDYVGFAACLAGPDEPPSPGDPICAESCRRAFDYDDDADVDLTDFGGFQRLPARLLGARSWKTHGSGLSAEEFHIALPLESEGSNSPGVETRMIDDPVKLTFEFDNPPQLPAPATAVACLTRENGATYQPASATRVAKTLTVVWAPVPNAYRYVVCLNVPNLMGDSDVEVIVQLGNVKQVPVATQWRTDSTDATDLVMHFGLATQSNCKYDITQTPSSSEKTIDGADRSALQAAYSGPVQSFPVTCP